MGLYHEGKDMGYDTPEILEVARRFAGSEKFKDSSYSVWRFRESAVYRDLEALMKAGDTRAVVRRIEQACAEYLEGRNRIGGNLKAFKELARRDKNSGYPNRFNHLLAASDSLDRNLPKAVTHFLDDRTCYSSEIFDRDHPYENAFVDAQGWKTLAAEMCLSNVPILRALGSASGRNSSGRFTSNPIPETPVSTFWQLTLHSSWIPI